MWDPPISFRKKREERVGSVSHKSQFQPGTVTLTNHDVARITNWFRRQTSQAQKLFFLPLQKATQNAKPPLNFRFFFFFLCPYLLFALLALSFSSFSFALYASLTANDQLPEPALAQLYICFDQASVSSAKLSLLHSFHPSLFHYFFNFGYSLFSSLVVC